MKKSKSNKKQEFTKNYLEDPKKLKGKTRDEIISLIGHNYNTDNQELLVYPIKQPWYTRRGKQLMIDFDENGKADTIITIKS